MTISSVHLEIKKWLQNFIVKRKKILQISNYLKSLENKSILGRIQNKKC